jgi:hypothetical protein
MSELKFFNEYNKIPPYLKGGAFVFGLDIAKIFCYYCLYEAGEDAIPRFGVVAPPAELAH